MTTKPKRRASKQVLAPVTVAPVTSEVAPALSAELLVTILSHQVAFLREHYSALAQRFAAGEVHSQRIKWDQGTQLVQNENVAVEQTLAAIHAQYVDQAAQAVQS